MNPLASIAAWTCIALVAMPMSPCALVPQICALANFDDAKSADHSEAKAAPAPAEHSCCNDATEAGQEGQHKEPAQPCPQGCCRLSPIAPRVDKVDAPSLAGFMASLPWTECDRLDVDAAPVQEALLPAQTLQSLLCLWRC